MKSKWFIVTIILKCEVEGKPTNPDEWTCIEQIHVVRECSRDDVFTKALQLGKLQETSYLNKEGKIVSWKFVGLENLEELPNKVIKDGTELWRRVFYTENPDVMTVNKERLSIFYDDKIANLSASEILENGVETKLICNRVPR